MPSVTVTTVPTLRSSVALANLSMRALMRSLISDALMAISATSFEKRTAHFSAISVRTTTPPVFRVSVRERDGEPIQTRFQRTVDHEVARAHDRTADQ